MPLTSQESDSEGLPSQTIRGTIVNLNKVKPSGMNSLLPGYMHEQDSRNKRRMQLDSTFITIVDYVIPNGPRSKHLRERTISSL